MKIGFYCCLIAAILTLFLRNVCWVVLHQAYKFCANSSFWVVSISTEGLKCWIKLLKLFTQVSHCGLWASGLSLGHRFVEKKVLPRHLYIDLCFQYACKSIDSKCHGTVMIWSFRTDMPGQTVQTQIRLLLEEQSDQGLHCLPFRLHRLDSWLYGRAT